MPLIFEWDSNKAASNFEKHGIKFSEAATVFGDALSITISDPSHSMTEERFIIIGQSFTDRVLVVVHTVRRDRIRLISARRANRREIKIYEEATF